METIFVSSLIDNFGPLEGGNLQMEGYVIKCSDCNEWYPSLQWKTLPTDCETCGGHDILLCPGNCLFDQYSDNERLEIREQE